MKAGKWTFAALWVNGERRIRARMPNEGSFFYTAGKAPPITDPKTGKPASSGQLAFRFKPGDIKRLGNLDDAVVVVYQSWEVGHQRIASVDEAKHVVSVQESAAVGVRLLGRRRPLLCRERARGPRCSRRVVSRPQDGHALVYPLPRRGSDEGDRRSPPSPSN